MILRHTLLRAFWKGSLAVAFAAVAAALPVVVFSSPQGRGALAPRLTYTVRWTHSPNNTKQSFVEVLGLSDASLQALRQTSWTLPEWQSLLAIMVQQGDTAPDESVPPMLGTYRVEAKTLRFEPKFPLQSGVAYRAVFRPDRLPDGGGESAAPISSVFRLPLRKSISTTFVRQIYPGAAVLPENLLKFYIYFSAPMRRGGIYDYIHLLDAQGKEVELPFLQIDEELWDTTFTRLTLFLDPGRIKRGVLPLEEVGPALQVGKRYTLVIDHTWKDGEGNPLKADFRKAFRVGPPDRTPPDSARWKMQPPKSGTRAPLAVTFPEPMEHALAQRFLRVTDRTGKPIAGKIVLSHQERRWMFTPDSPWRRGRYVLVIRTILEDLAGNNIGKPFDVDLATGGQRSLKSAFIKRTFVVR